MDFWGVIIILEVFFSTVLLSSGNAVRESGEAMGIFSVFPLVISEVELYWLPLAGLLFVLSDIPVIFDGIEYHILHLNRTIWYLSQMAYAFLISATYFFVLFLGELVFFLPNLSLTAEWGSAVESGAYMGAYFYERPESLFEQTALAGCARTFCFLVLLGFLFSAICCVANLLTHEGIGILVCALLIFADFVLKIQLVYQPSLLSPVGVATDYVAEPGRYFPVFYFIFLALILWIIGLTRCHKIDIKSERKH